MMLKTLEAVDSIKVYHVNRHPAEWLHQQTERIGNLAATVSGMTRILVTASSLSFAI